MFVGGGFVDELLGGGANALPMTDEDGDGVWTASMVVPEGTTARGVAYAVHTDLGDGFIRATDAKSSRVIGAEHEVQNGDIISIHAKT